jgi:hypothetical protein
MLYLASILSNFWNDYAILFLFGVGMLITNMTGNLNLASTAEIKFNPHFYDPYVFVIVLIIDHLELLPLNIVAMIYILMVVVRIILYLVFMDSVVTQLCDYMDLPFLTVKQGYRSVRTGKVYD